MRRTFSFLLLFFLSVMTVTATPGDLQKELAALKGISSIEELQFDYHPEEYVVRITQQIDPKNPTAETLTQQVIVGHVGYNRPTITVTEGYGAAYALSLEYQEELSKLLNASLIFMEYRYFLESMPEPKNWGYLTTENSAYGLHNVRNTFKQIYPGRWISADISKGGRTTVLYRAFFPDGVDFSVPYVNPLCKGVEDGRHEPFLCKVGTKAERERIQNFQLEVSERKSGMLPLLESYCKNKDLTFRIPVPEVLDYCVLECSFTPWQWGTSVSTILSRSADDQAPFDHLVEVSGSGYFAESQPNISFLVQTARELGYYGYDIKPFKEYLMIGSAHGYPSRIMLPEELVGKVDFRPVLYHKIYNFLKDNDPKVILIYDGIDPWSAAVVPTFKGGKNKQICIQPRGSHRARIGSIPEDMKERILTRINKWLAE